MEPIPVSLSPQQPLYEVLNYEAVLELLDTAGHRALYTRRQTIRFLQDHVTGWWDYGWGNGIAFAEHEVSPGRIIERQLLGSRHRTRIEFPEPKAKGDEFTFTVSRRIDNGFLSPSECWLEAELYHAAKRLTLRTILPPSRPVRAAHLVSLHAPEPQSITVSREPDGRQILDCLVPRPAIGERFTLLWEW